MGSEDERHLMGVKVKEGTLWGYLVWGEGVW